LVLLLVFAVVLSSALGQYGDAALIFGILFLTGAMASGRNIGPAGPCKNCRRSCTPARRFAAAGPRRNIRLEDVVPGDIALLRAGDVVPVIVCCCRAKTCT
jgi:Mg2+-importing ATPase